MPSSYVVGHRSLKCDVCVVGPGRVKRGRKRKDFQENTRVLRHQREKGKLMI